MLKRGEINNCIKCGCSYGQYDLKKDNDFSEYWCIWKVDKEPKGLCQFCNPASKYFNKEY